MKLVKMSLAAAVLLGASAFAMDNVKVSGDAKLFYSTNNADYTKNGVTDSGLFDQGVAGQGGSQADAAIRLNVVGDINQNVKFGATAYGVSTFNLEQEVVSNTWTGAHDVQAQGGVDEATWLGELYVAATLGKTTAKIGRMELDTPFAFSEKWSVAANTFEAIALINQDLPDTTLVGAWVAKGNGANVLGANSLLGVTTNESGLGMDGIIGADGKFSRFAYNGAYAVAAVNNSFKPLTAQAWFYSVDEVANAYWLQADIDCQLVKGVKIGAQYGEMSPTGLLKAAGVTKDSDAYAVKLAYQGIEGLNVSAAYSEADKAGTLKIANVATDNLGGAQSKLYTEAWWNYGYVGAPGAESINLTAEYDAKDVAKVGAYYTTVDNNIAGSIANMDEITVTVSKSFGPLDASLAYISTDADDQNSGKAYTTLQAYLTLNF